VATKERIPRASAAAKQAAKELAFLREFDDDTWRFLKGGVGREFLAVELEAKGLLARTMKIYSLRAGGEHIEYRSAYRITALGRVVRDAATCAAEIAAEKESS
jgi:hypothetical protein